MEPESNFALALRQAYEELNAADKLTEQDRKVVGQLLQNPVMTGPDGKEIRAMRRVHRRVRRYYIRRERAIVVAPIDWEKLVEWLKEHWLDIVRIILSILPFLIL